MKKNPLRAVLIWAVILVALFNIYPTVGWMTLTDDTEWLALDDEARAETEPDPGSRQARMRKWQQEDDLYARERSTTWQDVTRSLKRWSEFDRDRVINLGLDLQGGVHMVIGFDIDDLPEERLAQYESDGYSRAEIEAEVQEIVLQQIRRRVNDFEAREPVIQALGRNQIQIQLPGEQDIQRAKDLITKTALLNFHIAAGPDESARVFARIRDAFPDDFIPFIEPPTLRNDPFRVPVENYHRVREVIQRAEEQGVIPGDKMVTFSHPPKPYQPQHYDLYVLDRRPMASGEGLTSSSAVPDQNNPGYWQILFNFNSAAGQHFGQVTGDNIGTIMAIVVDGMVVSAPVIRDRINMSGQISGNFDGEEAGDLAIALNSGSMAVPVREEFSRIVGASLGADSVRAGVISALVGIALVAAFIAVYYTMAGMVAVVSLALNAVLILAAMAYFNMTLTLPGIAGLILTVGMAVDANVLIFERIREELRLGHSLLASVENGFKRATVTILDANVTTLIAAIVLYQFGTGPIEGFAITLSIGVCATVFTSLVISRAIFDFLAGRQLLTNLKMFSILPAEIRIPFLSYIRYAAVGSAAVIFIGLAFFVYRGVDNFGVDFVEGTNLEVVLDSDGQIPVGDIRAALDAGGFGSPIVQEAGEGVLGVSNEFLIRVTDITAAAEAAAADDEAAPAAGVFTVTRRIQEALAPLTTSGTVAGVQIVDEQTVGPAVGRQLRMDAIKAVLASLAFIVLYLSFRFELKFALGAIAALVHDVVVTIGIFAVLGRQIDMTVIAAVLTIIGYSLNDTIVIFDRVREDLKLYRGKGYSFIQILDIAINNTLSRTVLTSMTTLFVVCALFFFGGRAINDFALALIIGVLVGTYSTIFVASPVLYLWQKYQGKHVLPTDTGRDDSARRRRRKKSSGQSDEEAGGAPA